MRNCTECLTEKEIIQELINGEEIYLDDKGDPIK